MMSTSTGMALLLIVHIVQTCLTLSCLLDSEVKRAQGWKAAGNWYRFFCCVFAFDMFVLPFLLAKFLP